MKIRLFNIVLVLVAILLPASFVAAAAGNPAEPAAKTWTAPAEPGAVLTADVPAESSTGWLHWLWVAPLVLGTVLGSQVENLPIESRVQGFTHLITLRPEDLTEATANTAQTFTIAIPAKSRIAGVLLLLDTPFQDESDAAFNSMAVTVGDNAGATTFLSSTELNVNGTEILMKTMSGSVKVYTAADTLKVIVNAMAAKALADIDKGRVRIYVNLITEGQIG